MIKDGNYSNFNQWFWEKTLFYIKERKLPPWPDRYHHWDPFEKWKYFSTLGLIDLEKAVVGEINVPEDYHAQKINQWDVSPRNLLKNSFYVEFLRSYGHREAINEEEFNKTSYYEFILYRFKKEGNYYGITNSFNLLEQANYFLKLYCSIRDGSFKKNYRVFPKIGKGHSFDKYPTVVKLSDGFWGIREGHHRLSAQYCFKKRWAWAHIVLEKNKIVSSHKET